MYLARKVAASVLGRDAQGPNAQRELEEAGVPVTGADCRTCADPCDKGHEDFPKRFDVDRESEMRGSVKPYRRQVLVSTGTADWAKDVTSVDNTLAKFLSDADASSQAQRAANPGTTPTGKRREKKGRSAAPRPQAPSTASSPPIPPGVSPCSTAHTPRARTTPTHTRPCSSSPDYVAVTNVPVSTAGAEALWRHALDPAVSRAGTAAAAAANDVPGMKTWTLPYNCVILLCSHKRRDARCHIAAKRLEKQKAGPSTPTSKTSQAPGPPPLEQLASTSPEREAAVLARLQALDAVTSESEPEPEPSYPGPTQKTALILKNSHIGGHKFAGNVIIYFPQGLGVWYGRVSPHEVPAVVKHTIVGGKVLAPLLRGGLNISRPGRTSLLEW